MRLWHKMGGYFLIQCCNRFMLNCVFSNQCLWGKKSGNAEAEYLTAPNDHIENVNTRKCEVSCDPIGCNAGKVCVWLAAGLLQAPILAGFELLKGDDASGQFFGAPLNSACQMEDCFICLLHLTSVAF